MDGVTKQRAGATMLAEIQEFAGFAKGTQRYIRRSLDVGLGRRDAMRRWARDPAETASIRAQEAMYRRLEHIGAAMPEDGCIEGAEGMMAPLVTLTAFDLGQGRLTCFRSYRFLYERLLGAAVRPWLPGAFCAAAALPHLHPDVRRRLLQSLSESVATAAGWSLREPLFVPEWVEKVTRAIDA
jgi:hypothetical protein